MPSVRWAWWDGGEMLWPFCAPRLKASGKQHIRLIDEWLGRFETCVRSIENGGPFFSVPGQSGLKPKEDTPMSPVCQS